MSGYGYSHSRICPENLGDETGEYLQWSWKLPRSNMLIEFLSGNRLGRFRAFSVGGERWDEQSDVKQVFAGKGKKTGVHDVCLFLEIVRSSRRFRTPFLSFHKYT